MYTKQKGLQARAQDIPQQFIHCIDAWYTDPEEEKKLECEEEFNDIDEDCPSDTEELQALINAQDIALSADDHISQMSSQSHFVTACKYPGFLNTSSIRTGKADHCTHTKTTKPLPDAEESMCRQILRKPQELLKDSDQARVPGTVVERCAHWNMGSVTAGVCNAANAAAVASAVASKAATQRTKLFKEAKVPHFLQVSTGDVNQLKKLVIGDFGIVWMENGLMVAEGLVLTAQIYLRN
ncbi:hypothetical protein B0H14DRAFT_2560969 [Mycena olivaceomarginata]|nr:hypothetical protein B0H14DRAFT_2560969 [Mycena olivaceomarginata]